MDIELFRIARAIRRFWWVAAASAAIGLALMVAVSSLFSGGYTARSTVVMLSVESSGVAADKSSFLEIAASDSVLKPIMDEYGIEAEVEDYRASSVRLIAVPGTSLIWIEVSDSDPQRAADIANDITTTSNRSFEQLSRGVVINLRDELVFQRDQIDGEMIVIDTRISGYEDSEADLPTGDQSVLDSLRAEKFRLQQRRADIESSVRGLEANLASMQPPVAVVESAVPPTRQDGVSWKLMGAIGVAIGGLVGLGLMLWLELRDKRVRDSRHAAEIIGTDGVIQVSNRQREEAGHLLAARAAGIARTAGSTTVVVASARNSEQVQMWIDAFLSDPALEGIEKIGMPGMLDTPGSIALIPENTIAMLVAEEGRTSADEMNETMGILRDFGVSSVSPVLIRR